MLSPKNNTSSSHPVVDVPRFNYDYYGGQANETSYMRRPRLEDVHSHWSKLFENFETSVTDFYSSVQTALEARDIPLIDTREVKYREEGPFTPKRIYFRVTRERLSFDICAAPFGNGFFFSWWLSERPPSGGFLYLSTLLAVSFGIVYGIADFIPGFLGGGTELFATGVCFLILFLMLIGLARLGVQFAETIVLALPIFGRLYQWYFKPQTYYHIDTLQMYQTAVHAAVLEVIDELTTAKGLRGLTEAERKPILREYFTRSE